jgi:hypothetical protein
VAVVVALPVALSVAVANSAGQWWLAVVRAVGVLVMGGGQGANWNSNGGVAAMVNAGNSNSIGVVAVAEMLVVGGGGAHQQWYRMPQQRQQKRRMMGGAGGGCAKFFILI